MQGRKTGTGRFVQKTSVDSVPTAGSTNLITSGAVHQAIEDAAARAGIIIAQEISANTMVAVTGGYECVKSVDGVTANTCFNVYGLDATKLGAQLTITTEAGQIRFSSAAAPLASQIIIVELRG